jgi:hypothetical protein
MAKAPLCQRLRKPVVLEVGYVGSAGHHLFRFRDINQRVTPLAASHPYPDYGYIDYLETSANSNYNSLQTQLRVRNLHGIESTLTL